MAFCGMLLSLLYALRPISDQDFWWHLKTGEEMFRIGGLLPADPFCFTGNALLSPEKRMILHGYWVWDLLYYAVYAGTGLWGIQVLNLLLLLAIYGTLAWLLTRQGNNGPVGALLLVLSLATFVTYYILERPQVFSFLFCLLLLALFDRFRDERRLSGWLFPLMLLWGNVHGGVIVGLGLLFLFMAGVAIQLRHDRQLVVRCALWSAGGMACGLLNPAAVYAVTVYAGAILHPVSLGKGVREFSGTARFFQEGFFWVGCLWLLMVLHGAGLVFTRKRWLADILFFLVLLPASFFYMRNVAFFAVCLLPQTAYYLGSLNMVKRRWSRYAAGGGGIALLVLLALNGFRRQEATALGEPAGAYPVRLVEFIQQAGIAGKAFNDYDWGGFLLWKLYPETRLFIDGRNLDREVYNHWLKIRWSSPLPIDGRAEYQWLLDHYGAEYVIEQTIAKSGLTSSLVRALLASDEWIPVYQDESGCILVRNLPRYQWAIGRHRIDKLLFLRNIMAVYDRKILTTNHPSMYLGRGELALFLGDFATARRDLLVARQTLDENDHLQRSYLQQLLNRLPAP